VRTIARLSNFCCFSLTQKARGRYVSIKSIKTDAYGMLYHLPKSPFSATLFSIFFVSGKFLQHLYQILCFSIFCGFSYKILLMPKNRFAKFLVVQRGSKYIFIRFFQTAQQSKSHCAQLPACAHFPVLTLYLTFFVSKHNSMNIKKIVFFKHKADIKGKEF